MTRDGETLKTEFVMKFFTVFNIRFTFRMFEQLLLALKNRVYPEFTVVNMYFLSFRILNNLRLPWKTEFALKIFTVLKYFLSFRIFEQLALALKTEFALNFSSRGAAAPPASYVMAPDKSDIQWDDKFFAVASGEVFYKNINFLISLSQTASQHFVEG